MPYAKTDEQGRIIDMIAPDSMVEVLPEAARIETEDNFPAYFPNIEEIDGNTHYTLRDFRVEDGMAVFDPLPESLEAMRRADAVEHAPEHMESTDDAICDLYEQTLEQSSIMDEQDAAICALYEMMEA